MENARRDHQRNKSDIVNLVKHMIASDRWGDEKYKAVLRDLVAKDERLVRKVTRIIKERRADQGSQT